MEEEQQVMLATTYRFSCGEIGLLKVKDDEDFMIVIGHPDSIVGETTVIVLQNKISLCWKIEKQRDAVFTAMTGEQ